MSSSSRLAPPRFLDVADGQHDLDVCRQEPRALQSMRCRAHAAADRRRRGVVASLRHPHQGETRLWFQAPLAGASIRLLGRRKLPAKAVDLRLLVERRGGGLLVDPLGTLAGALRLLDRVLPGAVQLHDLGAMDPADPREGDHVGLLLAPPGQRSGPLAGAAECVHLLTGPDHAAVHQTRDEWRQLRRRDRDHDLVQQRQPPLNLPLLQSNPTLLVPGAGDQVCVFRSIRRSRRRSRRSRMRPRSRRRQAAVPRRATADSPARRIRASRVPATAGHGRATQSRAPSLREREDADQARTRSGQLARPPRRPDTPDVRARAHSDNLRRDRPDTPPWPAARDLYRRGAWPDRRARANRRHRPTFAAHNTSGLAQVRRACCARSGLAEQSRPRASLRSLDKM